MDREKVIKDLEECMTASCRGYRPRLSCPYNDEEWDIMREALVMLKEQETEIRQLRLALDIAKGTYKGIKSDGGQFADMPTMQSAT